MSVWIHNISQEERIYIGVPIQPDGFWQIPAIRLLNYSNNEKLITDIMNGVAAISKDGVSDISEAVEGLNFLKGLYEEPRTSTTGVLKVAFEKPDDPSTTLVSHDWCNPTTWYSKSERTVGGSLSLKGGTTDVWETGKEVLIDVKHGHIYSEDSLVPAYGFKLYDDDLELEEDEDYHVDYLTGEVTIDVNYTVLGTLTADYSQAKSSEFILEPTAGKVLIIEHTELNFSKDAVIDHPLDFEIYVGNPYFNPQLPESPTNPMRVLYKKLTYKNEKDIINASNLGQGYIPKFGNLQHDILVFPFNYVTSTAMKSSQLVQLRIRMRNDNDENGKPIGLTGTYGTVSFYVISHAE